MYVDRERSGRGHRAQGSPDEHEFQILCSREEYELLVEGLTHVDDPDAVLLHEQMDHELEE